ncbi:MAG: hypothetical protein JWR63_1284 [Conexibacter sp.]|nr:hypothetical protein [Conexibacter sp.]
MSAHDELRRQLAQSTVEQAAGKPPVLSRGPRGPRRWGLLLAPILVVGSVGGAAALSSNGATSDATARELHNDARSQTEQLRVCQRPRVLAGATLVDGDIPPEAIRELPGLAEPSFVPATLPDSVVRLLGPARIIRQSLLTAVFPGDLRIVVAVSDGTAISEVADPRRCLAARETYVAQRPARDAARDRAIADLRQDEDVRPSSQFLRVWRLRETPGKESGAGFSFPIRAGHPIHVKVLGTEGGGYFGIAKPSTRTITVIARQTGKRMLRVRPSNGLFGFRAPRGARPLRLEQRDAEGTLIARNALR